MTMQKEKFEKMLLNQHRHKLFTSLTLFVISSHVISVSLTFSRHNSACGFEADKMPEEHVSGTISVSSFILSSNIVDMAIIKAPISSSMLTLGAIEAIYDFITYSSMKKGQFCIQLVRIRST